MEYITATAITIFGVFATIVIGLCKDEVSAWLPIITIKLINVAVKRAPLHLQDQYSKEWPSHVSEYPGKLTQFFLALGFIRAAGSLKSWNIHRFNKYVAVLFMCLNSICAILGCYDSLVKISADNSYYNLFELCAIVVVGSFAHFSYVQGLRIAKKREAAKAPK